MRDILRILYFMIPLGSIGILATLEMITPSQADWMAFGWLFAWFLRYYKEIAQLLKRVWDETQAQ